MKNLGMRSFVACSLAASLAIPSAPAMSESSSTAHAIATDRARVVEFLSRPEAEAQLRAHGVEAADARARVAALTDEEAAQLAAQVDQLPAGGNPGFLAFLGIAIVAIPVVAVAAVVLAVAGVVALVKKASNSA